jgi:hypothetical protein
VNIGGIGVMNVEIKQRPVKILNFSFRLTRRVLAHKCLFSKVLPKT